MPRSESITRPRALGPARATADGASGLMFATAPAADGGAAAALPLGRTTVLGRLIDQLDTLGLSALSVITRPDWREALEAIAERSRPNVRVVACAGLAEDLRAAAALSGDAPGTLLVARADVVCHREALAGLLAEPRIASGILLAPGGRAARWAYGVRGARGRIVSAGSPFHRVGDPNGCFLGFLKVAARDRDALTTAAGRLAELAEDLPPAWDEELARKPSEWRLEGEDAVSLLLTGLVRADVRLAASRAGEFYFEHPTSEDDARRSLRELGSIDEDRAALDAAVKFADGFFTTFFVSPYSKHLARFCARRGWTPNQMTTVSMAIGIAAAGAFATGARGGMVAGAVLLQAAFTVDCVDGQLARYTHTFSRLGAWLDSFFDRAKEYLVFAGLALGASRGFGQDVWALAAAALALQTTRHVLDWSFGASQDEALDAAPRMPLEQVADAPADGAGVPWRDGGPPTPHPAAGVPRAPDRRLVRLARRLVDVSASLERAPTGRWAKRILTLPIGERFALISITAALFSPRTTFIALLAWGGVALLYGAGGRLARSVAR